MQLYAAVTGHSRLLIQTVDVELDVLRALLTAIQYLCLCYFWEIWRNQAYSLILVFVCVFSDVVSRLIYSYPSSVPLMTASWYHMVWYPGNLDYALVLQSTPGNKTLFLCYAVPWCMLLFVNDIHLNGQQSADHMLACLKMWQQDCFVAERPRFSWTSYEVFTVFSGVLGGRPRWLPRGTARADWRV